MEAPVRPSVRRAIEQVHCTTCHLAPLCWSSGLPAEAIDRVDRIIVRTPPIHAGTALYTHGEPVEWLYVVRSGAVKALAPPVMGETHITGLFLPGDMVGMDGIGYPGQTSEAIALDTTTACAIPYAQLIELTSLIPEVQQHLLKVLSARIREGHQFMATLTHMSAEQKLAGFLVGLSNRLQLRGLSGRHLLLPISRGDLANYLGLSPETISRLLARLQQQRIIVADRREITIIDTERLEAAIAEDDE